MSEVILPFERAEYDARIAKTRRAMTERGIDLLIVTDPSNMAWLTGYDGRFGSGVSTSPWWSTSMAISRGW